MIKITNDTDVTLTAIPWHIIGNHTGDEIIFEPGETIEIEPFVGVSERINHVFGLYEEPVVFHEVKEENDESNPYRIYIQRGAHDTTISTIQGGVQWDLLIVNFSRNNNKGLV